MSGLRLTTVGLALCAALAFAACGPSGSGSPDGGSLHVTTLGMSSDVSGVLYTITCDDGTSLSEYVPLETEGLPSHVDPTLAGLPFADWFQVLPETTCVVTATAMEDESTPAEGCSVASQEVTIVAEQTTELVLEILCGGEPTGALDVTVVIVDGLSIVGGVFNPSKYILQCEEVTFSVDVEGGDGNYTYDWQVIDSPDGAIYSSSSSGNVFTFMSEVPGEYTVQVTVTDGNGETTTLSFPIHVGMSQSVEHCDEICCKLPDGSVGIIPAPSCESQGGNEVGLDVCEEEVCCENSDGTYSLVDAMNCDPDVQVEVIFCEQICCETPNGLVWQSAQNCDDLGGLPALPEACLEEVCCKTGNGNEIVSIADCPDGQLQPMELCDDGTSCCLVDGQAIITQGDAHCHQLGGQPAPADLCTPSVCCKLPDGTHITHPKTTCEELGGIQTSDDQCDEICCELEGTPPPPAFTATTGSCKAIGGNVVSDEVCEQGPEIAVWEADYTLDPTVVCEDSPYLVVPSSNSDEVVVYDLATLLPLPNNPFPVCDNPSRVMMDPNTDVYATCRGAGSHSGNTATSSGLGGGEVVKKTREGVHIWTTPISMCAGTRAVTMSGDGRLFAGCSHGAFGVYELNPQTGAVIDFVATTYSVYGLWATPEGIWASHAYNGFATFIGHTPTLTVDFTITNSDMSPYKPYGVAADAAGNGWFSLFQPTDGNKGKALLEVHTDATFTIHPLPVLTDTMGGRGLQVGLDGLVYIAQSNGTMTGAGYVTFDPLTQLATTTAIAGLNSNAHSSHGLTLDVANNVYLLERFDNKLYKIEPDGTQHQFGEDASGAVILDHPYGYSGDMTGMANSCIAGTTDTWFGAPIDSGNANTQWSTITWTATTPPGSSVTVQYSDDGGDNWYTVQNGDDITVTAQILEVRAILQSTIPGNEPSIDNIQVVYQP